MPTPSEFNVIPKFHTDRRSPVRWVLSHVRHSWFLVLVMLAGALGNAALAAMLPVYIGDAFEAILAVPPQLNVLLTLTIWIIISQLTRSVLQLGRNYGSEVIGQRLERDVRDELYTSLLGKSMTFHNLQPVGDTMARATNDVREMNIMLNPGLNLVIGSALFLVMPIAFAPRYHPALMLVPALFLVFYALSLWQYLHDLNPITTLIRSAFGRLNTRLAEALDGIETVKGAAKEADEVERFTANARVVRDGSVRQGDVEARFLPPLLMIIAQTAGLLHSLFLFQAGALTLSEVVGYFGLLQLFGFPVFTSLFAYSQVSSGMASARRILELINRETALDQNAAGHVAPVRGEVEFRDVSFSYNGKTTEDDLVLADLSFTVHPGQTVAIVGQTGSGKTSLVKLVNRTYDVSTGQVFVDGVDVRDWNLEALRQNISIIEQDIFLYSRTVRDNIAFGKPDASEEEIRAVAIAAQADEFVKEFKDGYQTVVGERGVTLSGGQRQRLALARAFLTDPRILVLDDSTSAIDSETEDKIQRAIYAAAEGRTTFIITHRLSQIRWADLIIVMRKGRIAAIGRHEELLASSEAYRRIFSDAI